MLNRRNRELEDCRTARQWDIDMARRIVAMERLRRGPTRLPSEVELGAMLMLYTVDQVIRKYNTDVFANYMVRTRINDLMARPMVAI